MYKKTFPDPIIGQEAVCPDGLGRVTSFDNCAPYNWICVETYVADRSCQWDHTNVKLVKIGEFTDAGGYPE